MTLTQADVDESVERLGAKHAVIDAESTAIVPRMDSALSVDVDMALKEWNDYQRLTRELLDETDFQQIGSKKFKKKSAWRKYARAFNITDRVTSEEIVRGDDQFPLFARIRVEARAPNGRTAEADQECHVNERCCQSPCPKRTWRNHECCSDCDGRKHWSHPGDLPATALTRAKNRAISDLIGAGEVSAEEMQDRHEEQHVEGQERDEPRQRNHARQSAPAAQRTVARERSQAVTGDGCATCHAPAGKPHATSCAA